MSTNINFFSYRICVSEHYGSFFVDLTQEICLYHTISQFCPPKLSKQSHLYVPNRLIQARAALHGCIVLHSSISSEQSIPVHPGSKY